MAYSRWLMARGGKELMAYGRKGKRQETGPPGLRTGALSAGCLDFNLGDGDARDVGIQDKRV